MSGSYRRWSGGFPKFFERTLNKILDLDNGSYQRSLTWDENKLVVCHKDKSKTRFGVKYNRLMRLRGNIHWNIKQNVL